VINNPYSSPYSVGVKNSRRIRWAGDAPRMEQMRCAYTILIGKSEKK
jgi:hypothetical protein